MQTWTKTTFSQESRVADMIYIFALIVCLANNLTVNPSTCLTYWSFPLLTWLSCMFYTIVDVFKSPLQSLSLESLFFVITHIQKYVGGVKNLWGNQPDMKHGVEGWKYSIWFALSLIFEPLWVIRHNKKKKTIIDYTIGHQGTYSRPLIAQRPQGLDLI